MKGPVYGKAAVVVWLLFVTAAAAATTDNTTTTELRETVSTSKHTVKINGKRIRCDATAGEVIIRGEENKPAARIFFTAYRARGYGHAQRPIAFAFNGGPGSSSVWLHFGALGPKRVKLNPDGSAPPMPPVLVDNEDTWLAFTDMVFVDPVGTGYSRAVGENKEKSFYDYRKDIESVADFIRIYLTRYGRWLSPVFLVGESYGTTRAAGLAEHLLDRFGIAVSGLVLISPALDFTTFVIEPAHTLPYVLYLPTYAAASHFHGRFPPEAHSLQSMLQKAETWAVENYAAALLQGNALSREATDICVAGLERLTGLPGTYIRDSGLKIVPGRFRKELLRNDGMLVGRMDARITGPSADAARASGSYDPALDSITGHFAGAANHYIRQELGYESDLPYEYLNMKVNRQWSWTSALRTGQGFVTASEALTKAMRAAPHLSVFVASGYYDLATPYFAARYSINQLDIPPQLGKNIILRCYEAGHMMYTDEGARKALSRDAGAFFAGGLQK